MDDQRPAPAGATDRLFNSLADNLPDVISRLDREHRHVYVNRQIEAVTGIPVAFYLGKTNRELGMPPELVEQWEAAIERVFTGGQAETLRFSFPGMSGERHYESRIVPERAADGSIATVLGIARDVTDAVLAEQRLVANEEQYRSIIENMQDVYYRADSEGRLVMISPSGAAMLGYDSVDDIVGLSVRDHFYLDPAERDAFLHNLRLKGRLSGYELTLRRRDGSALPAAVSSRMLYAPDGSWIGVEGVCRDISQYRQAIEQLRSSEEKFARAFNHAPVLMTISEIETGRYLEINEQFCRVSGFTRAEVLGRTSLEIGWLSAEERERILEHFLRDGRVHDLELELRAKDGTPVHCLYSGERITVDGREQLLSIALDVTARKRDLEALAYANECFQQALSGTQHVLYRLNVKQGGYDYLSPAFETITGHRVEDFCKITFEQLRDYFHPDDRQRVFGAIDAALAGRSGPTVNFDLEYRLRKADGGYCWLHDTTTACFDSQGGLECFFGSAHDITDRKRTDAALQESEQKFRTLFATFQDAIFLTRADDGRIIECNDRLSGYSREELLGRTTIELGLWADLAERQQIVETIAARGSVNDFEASFRRRDGSVFAGSISTNAVSLGGEPFLLSVVRDVSDRVQLQQEREKAQRLSSLGVLAGGIAHDFNNILTGIVGNLSIAALQLGDSHSAADRLRECQGAARRATELTQQLLTFARGGEPVRRALDLEPLISEALSFALRGSNVRGDYIGQPGLWPVYADAGQLNQLFNNLLLNARQAMPAGGTVLVRAANCEIAPGEGAALAPGRYVGIEVQDQGCGIPQDVMDHIFDPYFTTKERGTGLGLASVYSIARRHGGQVLVASRPGRGSTFTVFLPVATEASRAEEAPSPSGPLRGSGRVLVMDDEAMIRDMALAMLAAAGYRAEACGDGAEAARLCATARRAGDPFRAVVLDLTVPGGVGGREAVRLIRAEDPEVRLIVSSGYSDDPIMADYPSYGFDGAVAKPYNMAELTGALAGVLAERGD